MDKKIIIQRKRITENNIPIIECCEDGAAGAPLVLLNHGTSGNAWHMLEMGARLAEHGCFCVMIDAVWHGERRDEKLDIMLGTSLYKEYYLNMLLLMAKDMSAIMDYYGSDARVDTNRIGMTGISQGGYVAYMTMTKDDRIKAAAPLIGSPDLTDKYGCSMDWEATDPVIRERVEKEMPLNHFEKMAKTALLIQNCNDDDVVPVSGVRRLNERLRPFYGENGQYKYIEYKGGHNCSAEMIDRAIDWLAEKL